MHNSFANLDVLGHNLKTKLMYTYVIPEDWVIGICKTVFLSFQVKCRHPVFFYGIINGMIEKKSISTKLTLNIFVSKLILSCRQMNTYRSVYICSKQLWMHSK